MLFRAYVDDSTEEKVRIFTVGGFVGLGDAWQNLEAEWSKLLPPGISHFHATDCFTGNREFKGMSRANRESLLDRLLALILRHPIRLVGHGVDEDAYKQFAPKPKQNEFGVNRYVAAFEGLVQAACESINAASPYGDITDDVCDFYIESGEFKASVAGAIERLKNDPTFWWRSRIGRDEYGDKCGQDAIPLLQVGDLGAFLSNKFLIHAADGAIPWTKYFEALNRKNRVWPIKKWGPNCLAVLRAVQGLPDLKDDDF
jgi:hypothetical protein